MPNFTKTAFHTSAYCLTLLLMANTTSHANEPQAIEAIPTTLSASEQKIIAWVDARHNAILAELVEHVEINTGTQNIAGLDTYRDLLEQDLQQLGFTTTRHTSPAVPILTCAQSTLSFADHLSAHRSGASKLRLLLNGHLDTVFGPENDFQRLEVLPDGVLKGPGVADMKGGIVIMLNALRVLHEMQILEQANITVLLNTDEEIGSLSSRPLIESLARAHDLGLVFEGSNENLVTRARKGLGQARLKVVGREAHAGAAHADGVSANLELAHKVLALEALTDFSTQTTVNVGVMTGGEKRNTVPGCAEAYIDMRFVDEASGTALKTDIEQIAAQKFVTHSKYPELPKTEVWATLHRPAKTVNATVDAMIAHAMGLSQVLGEPIVGTRYSGGGTDGSIAQGVGLPTLDTLGINGAGIHSSREEATVDSLIARTKLAAILLARLIDGSVTLNLEEH